MALTTMTESKLVRKPWVMPQAGLEYGEVRFSNIFSEVEIRWVAPSLSAWTDLSLAKVQVSRGWFHR